jgi:hypothetical protein
MMEFLMSIQTKIAALALAALAVTGTMASTTQSAQARGLGWGIAGGLQRRILLRRRLSPLRLGSPIRRVWQLHRPRSHLQLLTGC